MIISQTPYRVSFGGGGTDLPAFYRHEPGAVVSAAITQHMYVTVHGRFEKNIRVAYSSTEVAEDLSHVKHEIVRETMRRARLDEPLEITTIGDVPAGTGMGSSSALAVGLLNAFFAYKGMISSPEQLAQQACHIEIDVLGKPIGRQDQYAAAFGGLNFIRFNTDDTVDLEPIACSAETLAEFQRRMLLVYTNHQRSADQILRKQTQGTQSRIQDLRMMRDIACEMRTVLGNGGDLDEFARLLHEGWRHKRSLGFGISNGEIDQLYDTARRAGAQGGKLLGAGGGGFVLLMVPPERQAAVREALGRPQELSFGIDPLGSRIIFMMHKADPDGRI